MASKRTLKRKRQEVRRWLNCLHYFDYRCAYCGVAASSNIELNKDHFIPKSVGGKNNVNNIVPSCKGCNYSKADSYPEIWCNQEQLERVYTYFWDCKFRHYRNFNMIEKGAEFRFNSCTVGQLLKMIDKAKSVYVLSEVIVGENIRVKTTKSELRRVIRREKMWFGNNAIHAEMNNGELIVG